MSLATEMAVKQKGIGCGKIMSHPIFIRIEKNKVSSHVKNGKIVTIISSSF